MEINKVFRNKEFGEISVIVKDKKEYFEAIPVATILGYQNPRGAILRHCKKEGVLFQDVRVATGVKKDGSNAQKFVSKKYISEGNLYRLAMEIKKEREEKLMAQRKAENLEAIITIDTPYTNFGKKVAVSSDAITIGQFAKLLSNNDIVIGRNRLFTLLRDRGYLIKKGKDKNMPKQTYLEQGLFKIAENVVKTVEGEILSTTTLVTGKGQMYFLDLLSNLI